MLEINLVQVATTILSRNGPTGPLGENFKMAANEICFADFLFF